MVPRNEKLQLKRNNRKHWFLACVPLALAGAGMALFVAIDKQPSQYKGDTFTNVQTTVSSTTTSTSVSSSSTSVEDFNIANDTDSVYTESSDTEQVIPGSRAYQPTFEVEQVSSKYDLYTVKHLPTGDTTKPITYEDANAFCAYMEQIAYGKTQLEYSMDQNYNTWKGN